MTHFYNVVKELIINVNKIIKETLKCLLFKCYYHAPGWGVYEPSKKPRHGEATWHPTNPIPPFSSPHEHHNVVATLHSSDMNLHSHELDALECRRIHFLISLLSLW